MRQEGHTRHSVAETTRRALAEPAHMIDLLPGVGLKADEVKQQQVWRDTLRPHWLDAGVSFKVDLRLGDLWLGDPQL